MGNSIMMFLTQNTLTNYCLMRHQSLFVSSCSASISVFYPQGNPQQQQVAMVLGSLEQKTTPMSQTNFDTLLMFLALSKFKIFCLALIPYPLIGNTVPKSMIYYEQPVLVCINMVFNLSAFDFMILGMRNSINTL